MFDQKKNMIWFNGKIIPQNQAQVNILNTSTQYGINVFEGIRCYYNRSEDRMYAFCLNEHINRLFASAKLLRFSLPSHITSKYLMESIKQTIIANNLKEDIYVKIGFYIDGEGSWSWVDPIGIYISTSPKGRVFEDLDGLSCCVSTWQRINDSTIPPRIKSGATYINSRLAFLEAKNNGYDYPILLNKNGNVSEGPGACIFIVRDGKLITPSITSSILESITRDFVVDLAKKVLDLVVEERNVDRTELYISDEVFFVGTSIEIVPVLSIDKYEIGAFIGEITEQLRLLYFKVVRKKLESDFLTLID